MSSFVSTSTIAAVLPATERSGVGKQDIATGCPDTMRPRPWWRTDELEQAGGADRGDVVGGGRLSLELAELGVTAGALRGDDAIAVPPGRGKAGDLALGQQALDADWIVAERVDRPHPLHAPVALQERHHQAKRSTVIERQGLTVKARRQQDARVTCLGHGEPLEVHAIRPDRRRSRAIGRRQWCWRAPP